MKFRAVFCSLVCLLTALPAHSAVYQRGERFKTSPKNWKKSLSTLFYGQEVTGITGNKGAAGGIFQPIPRFNYYADLYLGGKFVRDSAVSANGRLVLQRISTVPPYDATIYIGHFARKKVGNIIQVVGIAMTGSGGSVICEPVVEFTDGTAFVGESFSVPVAGPSRILEWSYSWNPQAGRFGYGQLEIQVENRTSQLDIPQPGLNLFLDAFGIFQPPFNTVNAASFLQMYVGDVSYTAFVGNPPRLKVKGKRHLRTQDSTVTVRGRAKVDLGNRVKVVRYRVNRDGSKGRFKKAEGTDSWKARVRVPKGSSQIEILARSDSGLVTKTTRKVTRK